MPDGSGPYHIKVRDMFSIFFGEHSFDFYIIDTADIAF